MLFIYENVKKTILDILQGILRVLYKHLINLSCFDLYQYKVNLYHQ